MRRALRNSVTALIALTAVSAHSARPLKEDAARREMEQAERARAAEQAAQQEAAARAAVAGAEARRLTVERVATAARLRQAETATADAAARIDALAAQRRRTQADLDARAETMQPLLPLIERLALYPAETLLAVPAAPEDALRGLLVLRGLAARVGQDALALRREQAKLAAASEAMATEAPRLAMAVGKQQAEAAMLDRQIAAAEAGRRAAEDDSAIAAQRAANQAARAENLRSMMADLEARRRADQARAAREARAERRKPIDAAAVTATAPPRQLIVPVAGTVVRAWGDATEVGPAMGMSYQPPPAARVVSPCRGRIAFAAPFRSYGLLLIVDCGGGYHAVLAGFERFDVKVGQDVAAGEPIGVMAGWEPGAPGSRPALYVELRRDGQPVNPAPWLRANG
jgi:septal ring factor EnvC (AmiA/AmiB activator)